MRPWVIVSVSGDPPLLEFLRIKKTKGVSQVRDLLHALHEVLPLEVGKVTIELFNLFGVISGWALKVARSNEMSVADFIVEQINDSFEEIKEFFEMLQVRRGAGTDIVEDVKHAWNVHRA